MEFIISDSLYLPSFPYKFHQISFISHKCTNSLIKPTRNISFLLVHIPGNCSFRNYSIPNNFQAHCVLFAKRTLDSARVSNRSQYFLDDALYSFEYCFIGCSVISIRFEQKFEAGQFELRVYFVGSRLITYG